LKDNKAFISNGVIENGDGIQVKNMPAGFYVFTLTDASRNVYADSFNISDNNAPPPPSLEQEYVLNGATLELNAATGSDNSINYRWVGPDGFVWNGPAASIKSAGTYTVCAESKGCRSYQQFRVTPPPKNVFTNIQVNPNPSGGNINVSISLDKPAPVTVEMRTEDGRLLQVKQLTGMANYYFSGHLLTPGVYFLVFRSGLDKQTRKIVIIR